MIKKILIKNFILIEYLEIEFKPNLTVITGETGAGKSILLGAIGLIAGNRTDINVIRANKEKCIVEAVFTEISNNALSILEKNDIDYMNGEYIVRREITSNGKNRAFINDTPVPLTLLKEISGYIIDIHSQHKNLLIGNSSFQLSMLDTYANNQQLLYNYSIKYKEYRNKATIVKDLEDNYEQKIKEKDFLEFQISKIQDLNVIEGEEIELQSERNILSHAKEIKTALQKSIQNINSNEYSAITLIRDTYNNVNGISNYSEYMKDLNDRIETILIDLKDIERDLISEEYNIVDDPNRLSFIENRIDSINELLARYNLHNTSQLISYCNTLKTNVANIETDQLKIKELKDELLLLSVELKNIAKELSEKRLKAAHDIEKLLIFKLKHLGIPHVRLNIVVSKDDNLTIDGQDKIDILFSANKNVDLEPVSKIASGGEISRLMLCIKAMLTEKNSLPTIVFDEIDTGVSGQIADRIGSILHQMGINMQVITVTHLPQIAVYGNQHIYIYKDQQSDYANTIVKELNMEKRIEEIARMQSGSNLSDISIAAAKELLQLKNVEYK